METSFNRPDLPITLADTAVTKTKTGLVKNGIIGL
jgi:hypothetical protein